MSVLSALAAPAQRAYQRLSDSDNARTLATFIATLLTQAQALETSIGSLAALTTTVKTSAVAAINELVASLALKAVLTAQTFTGRQTFTGGMSLGGVIDSPVTAAQAMTNGATVTLPTTGINKLLSTSGAVTGAIMSVGTVDGQMVHLLNASAASVTFDSTPATSKVAASVAVVGAGMGKMLVWDAGTSYWYPIG